MSIPIDLTLCSASSDRSSSREVWGTEAIKTITYLARTFGSTSAVERWIAKNQNKVTYSSVCRWLSYYKECKTYFTPRKRGRVSILTESCENEVLENFIRIRDNGETVDTSLIVSLVIAAFRKRQLGNSLRKNGGIHVFSTFWARCFLQKHGASVYSATSTLVTNVQKAIVGGEFYKELKCTSAQQ